MTFGDIRRWPAMTSPGLRQDPATHGSASLSPLRGSRFEPHWPYRGRFYRRRAAQDYPGGSHVPVMPGSAAITGPCPNGQGQLRAGMAAVRADARTALETRVDVPPAPCPFGLVAKNPKEPAQPGVGKRACHPGSHHAAQGQVLDGEAFVSARVALWT